MTSSPINLFQRLARQWDATHPYNAAQVLRIQGRADPDVLQTTWHETLNELGLGRVLVNRGAFHFESLNGQLAQYGVAVIHPPATLEDHVSAQLNCRFDDPCEPPFRPFVVPGDNAYDLGVVYHHWVADSVSIRTLLREWFVRLFDPARARRTALPLPRQGYGRFFDMMQQASAVGQGLLTATRWASASHQVRRIAYRASDDMNVRFRLRGTPDGFIDVLHQAARARGVTLNDLFMAAMAAVCLRHVTFKNRPHRRWISLGSIVDLRPYCGADPADMFGLFLGFTQVACRPQDFGSPERLLRAIARQNAQQKRRGMPQASALRMLLGVAAGSLLSPRRIAHYYRKHCPLAGGISNVNLNHSWATAYHPAPLLDYIRISPTGPMMPLVLATTTLGHRFHFALTYRPTAIPAEQVESLCDDYLAQLRGFTETR